MSSHVRFEDEADAEYRSAGRWYEDRRAGLGLEFFDAVDAAVSQIVDLPRAGERVPRMPAELPVRRLAVKRFPYHVFYLETTPEIRILAVAHDRRKPGLLAKSCEVEAHSTTVSLTLALSREPRVNAFAIWLYASRGSSAAALC